MVDVAGGGHVKIALETAYGTYTAPTKTVPVTAESLQEVRTDSFRTPLVGQAVTIGKTPGRHHVEGEITMEALPEVMAYFLIASRWGNNVQKTGVGPYVYTAYDDKVVRLETARRSLTIGVDRAGVGFAYLGCQVTSMKFSFSDGGVPMLTCGIMGRNQTNDYTPSAPSIPTELPFSVNEVTLSIAGSSRGDIDAESVEIMMDDNGSPKFNLTGSDRSDYTLFGEFVGEASYEIDFESKADYAIWVARTAQELILDATKDANQSFNLEFHGGMYDTFEVNLGDIGSQVRAAASLRAIYNATATHAASLSITTTEDITL